MSKRTNLALSDDDLLAVAEAALECKTTDVTSMVEHLRKRVCVDLTAYKDLVQVRLSYSFHRGGELDGGCYLLKESWLPILFKYGDIEYSFGECDGKHSDVYLSWIDLDKRYASHPLKMANTFPDAIPSLPGFLFPDEWDTCKLGNYINNLDSIDEDQLLSAEIKDAMKKLLTLQFDLWYKATAKDGRIRSAGCPFPTAEQARALMTKDVYMTASYEMIRHQLFLSTEHGWDL